MLLFSESLFLQKAKVMYKVSNNIAPEYLTDLFKMRESNSNSTLHLRSVSNKHFQIPKPKINLFKNSLSYSGAFSGAGNDTNHAHPDTSMKLGRNVH